jgi:hypothetical protein
MALTRLQIAKKSIFQEFDNLDNKVFTSKDLKQLLERNRLKWKLAQSTNCRKFTDFLVETDRLKKWNFDFSFRPETRFTWGDVSLFQVIASLKKNAYFSHYSAIYHHGLTEQIPKTIYFNSEQLLKSGISSLTTMKQENLDRSFKNKPRQSSNIAVVGEFSVCLVSGKNTDNLGVITAKAGDLTGLPVTDLERTLIDATVRPFYAGGPFEVLRAYYLAKEKLSINRLASLLKTIDFIYPYHQAVGFYLYMAGYSENYTKIFQEAGLSYDFYLTYQIKNPQYSEKWRIYFPQGLKSLA